MGSYPFAPSNAVLMNSVGWQQLAGQHTSAPGMVAWLTVLANRHYAAGTLVCLGTSVTAGNGAALWENAYPMMMQEALNNRFPSNGLASHGRGVLIPVLDWISPDYVTVTGSPAVVPEFGLNLATYDISAGGGCTLTYHLVGTSGFILYENQPGGGSFTWQVDAGSVSTVATAAGTVQGGQAVGFTLGGTVNEAHTLTITWHSGGAVWIDGVVEFNGDENAGLQVMNFGAGGSLTADWAATNTESLAGVPCNMYILEQMGNDWSEGVPVATATANLITLMDNLIAAAAGAGTPRPQFTLLALYNSVPAAPVSGIPWATYVNALYQIAAARTDTTVLDLSIRLPTAVLGGGPYGEYDPDGEHPSNIGHSLIGDIGAAFLGPQ